MNSNPKKILIDIEDNKSLNLNLFLENEFKKIKSSNIEIDCKDVSLTCTEILELIEIAVKYDCQIIGFCSSSPKTIISSQSLGYKSQFIIKDASHNNTLNINNKNLDFSQTHFHEGTVRSGEYLDVSGNLLILGDVNPGAIVSAEENIIIWGRLLGIAHAGSKGNSQGTISALQLRPVQLRIANKVARGPKESSVPGLAEQAKIDSEKIIIIPLDSI
tara:strand:+ start:653 stop:1303 length:651 start_codon:yes stop_codon:yes gene_type:complete